MSNPVPGRNRRRIRQLLHELWTTVQEPKEVTVIQFVIYWVALIGGIGTLIYPPTSVYGVMGDNAAVLWAVLMITGGALGVGSLPRGIWWLEQVALICLFTSMAMYFASVTTLQIDTPGSRFTQLAVILMLSLYLITRFARVRLYALDPEKFAQRQRRKRESRGSGDG